VRQMIGTLLLGVVGIVASILAIALDWPWPWWVWVLLGASCAIGGILMLWRDRKPSEFQTSGSKKNVAVASARRSVAVNNNPGIISTGDDTTIER
jgi:hypothetical protein